MCAHSDKQCEMFEQTFENKFQALFNVRMDICKQCDTPSTATYTKNAPSPNMYEERMWREEMWL